MDECGGRGQNEKTVTLVPKAREEQPAVSPLVCVVIYVCLHPGAIESREDIV